MVPRGYLLLFVVCLNIDFARQWHMRYKARNIIFARNLSKSGIPDFSQLPLSQKLAIFKSLGIVFTSKDSTI